MKKLLRVVSKYDYILILILILGVVFIAQQYTLRQNMPMMKDNLTVVVNVPLAENVIENSLFVGIGGLYFDQSRQLSDVSKIEKSANGVNVYFVGPGIYGDKFVFSGRAININDRIKLSGGLSGDGFIVKILNNND